MTSNFQQNLINFSACSHEGVFVFFGDMFADALRDALWRPYVCIVCVFHLRVDILHTSCCPVVLLLLLAHRYERQAASRKQDGIQAEFAKGHMPFQVYAVLTEETAKLTPSSAWGNVLALWAFMVLCFSLFCRGHNTAMITFGCLSVHQEALLLDFCKTKCNQNGWVEGRAPQHHAKPVQPGGVSSACVGGGDRNVFQHNWAHHRQNIFRCVRGWVQPFLLLPVYPMSPLFVLQSSLRLRCFLSMLSRGGLRNNFWPQAPRFG